MEKLALEIVQLELLLQLPFLTKHILINVEMPESFFFAFHRLSCVISTAEREG